MRLRLTGLKTLVPVPEDLSPVPPGFRRLKVLFCAVCRTDAKMWDEGHRDLVFPRVPGHEFVATDDDGRRFTVWPGSACGRCVHCRGHRENLCEEMKITGFHHDGGFAHHVTVPEKALVPVPAGLADPLLCFAEPVGCALHALEKLSPLAGERMVIFGGGTLGLLTALAAKARGVAPLIIEKNSAKIEKAKPFLDRTGIRCLKETNESDFHLAVNACPDVIAFSLCVSKLDKGGRLAFFSGLKKNETLESNLLNLAHYRELELFGAYGLNHRDMVAGLDFISNHAEALELLIEAVLPPEAAPEIMPGVLAGEGFKYILNFSGEEKPRATTEEKKKNASDIEAPYSEIRQILGALPCPIEPVGETFRAKAQFKIDDKAKPLGSLGKLEELAVRLAMIQNSLTPALNRKALFVFAADHGVAESGVSAYPAEVTYQMVKNFLRGGAAINVLARRSGIDLAIVDMGVNADFTPHPMLIQKKVRKGTRNFAIEPAMTPAEAIRALHAGMEVFLSAHDDRPIDILGVGEMGIGNTTSASAIICAVTGLSPRKATGRGTGVDDHGLKHKRETLEKALAHLRPDPENGFEILCKVGGFEIAGIAGAILAAASRKTAVVLDGAISTAAGLIARLICPDVSGYLIAGHKSVEISHRAALELLGLEPLIDFRMRLGEGTGAALAMDMAAAACDIMGQMATFDEAGVSKKNNGA
jgi:nicotinate-nucleotide--dimethylbenzimidazole phosphoribosyltransferase